MQIHHHVQDAESSDGTPEFLEKKSKQQLADPARYRLTFSSKPDQGMYDAVNKGMAKYLSRKRVEKDENTNDFRPEICAYLNCDEQYLPGTLRFVADFFEHNATTDILFGDYLIIDEEGKLLAFRKQCAPRLLYIRAAHLYNLSCTMFFRRQVWEETGFSPEYKDAGDEDFVVRALESGFRARHKRHYFATFTFSQNNMSQGENAQREYALLSARQPAWLKVVKPGVNALRRLEKLLSGSYRQKFPLKYDIYSDSCDKRTEFVSPVVGPLWPQNGNSDRKD